VPSISHNPQRLSRVMERKGFTLVELLVASTLALVIMASVASLFGVFGRTFSNSREISALVGHMRSAAWKLRQDLQGATVTTAPWIRPESNLGYFELIEGSRKDSSAAANTTNLVADIDDVLLFTTWGSASAFSGQLGSARFESPYAEVAWFCKPSTSTIEGQTLYTLYRRQLLVTSHVGAGAFTNTARIAFSNWTTFYQGNDLSVRRIRTLSPASDFLFPNGLGDLSKRENRFLHNIGGLVNNSTFPYPFPIATILASSTNGQGEILSGTREGEDVVLRNILAFDVRVFDSAINATGTYVDLGAGQGSGTLSGGMNSKCRLTASEPTYDTWSMHYEFNGIDEDESQGVDQGTNGLDASGGASNNIVDELEEFETLPPYSVPLRGLEVSIRCIEPTSKEIRQITVRHSFRGR
jgi:prepilin-type N-terminal cleavage/methylation domain-containing protein